MATVSKEKVAVIDAKAFMARAAEMAPYYASPECTWKPHIEYIYRDQENRRIISPPHQQEIYDFVTRSFSLGHQRVAIEAPWGHAKTQSLAIMYPLRQVGINPLVRIKICSVNSSIATLRVSAIKNIIEQNADYKRVFGNVLPGDKWGESAIRVRGFLAGGTDYTVQAGGVDSSVIGGRADLLILDDPCDMYNSTTEELRKKTIEKIRRQWLSRLAPKGRVLWIGTPWHREDAMQVITRNWQRLKICVDEDISKLEMYINGRYVKSLPLWESVWNAERLRAEQKENYKTFNIGFRLIPASDEDSTFQHLDKALIYGRSPKDYEYIGVWGGIDMSTKTRGGTVGVIGGVTPDHQRVVIDVVYLDDPIKIKDMLWDWHNAWGGKLNFVYVENNALQDAIVDMLRRESPVALRAFTTTGSNKRSFEVGLPVLDSRFANVDLVIPVPHSERDADDDCGRCKLIRALRLHPFASEDDSVMALWFCERAMAYYNRVIFA